MSDVALFEHGLLTENSDIRAHVSVVNRTIYVFQTVDAIHAILDGDLPLATAGQPGVAGPTADGWKCPVDRIVGLRRVRYESWTGWDGFVESLSTSAKGKLAVDCVRAAMARGRFPLWLDAEEDDRQYVQIKGTDILLTVQKRIEVKCDYRGGDRPLGTGNLFLQRAERNPLKRR